MVKKKIKKADKCGVVRTSNQFSVFEKKLNPEENDAQFQGFKGSKCFSSQVRL